MSMTIKRAHEIAGTLSEPSKMPGKGYGLPASECKVGAILRALPGSTCEGCYAMKGNYTFKNVQASQHNRLQSIDHPEWCDAMVKLIAKQCPTDTKGKRVRGKVYRRWFRWHDSGDLQSVAHLIKIIEVCERTPNVAHWLPTREKAIVQSLNRPLPRNLTIRASAAMVDADAPRWSATTSTVVRFKGTRDDECKAYTQDRECKDCRKCWTDTANVAYPLH